MRCVFAPFLLFNKHSIVPSLLTQHLDWLPSTRDDDDDDGGAFKMIIS